MHQRALIAALGAVLAANGGAVETRTVNDGNLVMEGIPPIPDDIVEDLKRFQNVRSAHFLAFTADGDGIYVSTRFGDVEQVHEVAMPGGARRQLTFFDEPVGSVQRRPRSPELTFTRDAGGNEMSQVFALDPADGSTTLLTDGESRNRAVVWNRDGSSFAWQSTRLNGASNDVWLMDAGEPSSAELVLEAPDGTWWGPAEFSANGSKLLIVNYVSVADSRVHVLDLDSGRLERVAGGGEEPTSNYPLAFGDGEDGAWVVTNAGSEFDRLAWQPFEAGADPEIVTADIPWDVDGGAISHDRRRLAFVTNENGRSVLYLMDTNTRDYRRVDTIPTGQAYGVIFSPDDSKLGLTLSTAQSPSDSYVLELGRRPLAWGELTRWTASEVGGLDTSRFRTPELVHYPTLDRVDGEPRQIPAWVYRPPGDGPHPVVISIHGGPEGQARPYFRSTYQMWLAKLGVAVVVPNVRGSSGYGKSYLALDNGMKREDSVRDIGALLDWIAARDDLDQSRVAVYGGSYGGYMVLASAVHYSDRLKAAVDVVGISNFVTFLENTEDYRRDLRRAEYGDERDPEMRAFLERISPLNNVDEIEVPMLIVQGENDPRVPVTESEQMVEALRDRGQELWYMNALNEGHGYKKKENRDVYQQAVVLFLGRQLLDAD